MPRVCTICAHAERAAIDAALVDRTVNRQGYRSIAQRFAVSPDAVYRHKVDHLSGTLIKAEAAKEVAVADDLLAQLRQLRNKAIGILIKAEASGELKTALLGIREARACIELLAEMEGELNRNPVINLVMAPEWIRTRTVLMHALSDFPEARAAAARALIEVDRDN